MAEGSAFNSHNSVSKELVRPVAKSHKNNNSEDINIKVIYEKSKELLKKKREMREKGCPDLKPATLSVYRWYEFMAKWPETKTYDYFLPTSSKFKNPDAHCGLRVNFWKPKLLPSEEFEPYKMMIDAQKPKSAFQKVSLQL